MDTMDIHRVKARSSQLQNALDLETRTNKAKAALPAAKQTKALQTRSTNVQVVDEAMKAIQRVKSSHQKPPRPAQPVMGSKDAAKSAAKIRGLQRESVSIEREYEQWNNQMSGMCSGRKAQRKSLSASEPPATTPMKLAFNAVGQRMQNATTRLCNDSSLSFYPFEIQEGMQSVRDALSATSLGLDVHKLRHKVGDARRTLAAQAEEGGASPSKSMKAKIGALRTKMQQLSRLRPSPTRSPLARLHGL